MSPKPLARITAPELLDQSTGPRAKLELEVPATWLAEGGKLEVAVPKLLCCARCDGGGCDSCERGGALRAPAEEQQRTIEVSLPGQHTTAVQLRIVEPFDGSAIEQLLVVVRPGTTASPGIKRTALSRQHAPTPDNAWLQPAVTVALVLLAIVLATLALTR